MLDAILLGQMQLWPGEKSACVTELAQYPRMKALRVFLAGGELGELVNAAWPAIKSRASEWGCQRVEVTGRKGWLKMLDHTREFGCLALDLDDEPVR